MKLGHYGLVFGI